RLRDLTASSSGFRPIRRHRTTDMAAAELPRCAHHLLSSNSCSRFDNAPQARAAACLKRACGVEPPSSPWTGAALPLSYPRGSERGPPYGIDLPTAAEHINLNPQR